MSISPIYLVHGFTASSKANWFPWLKEQLQKKGITLIVPDMPNTNDPHLLPWLQKLEETAKEINENSIFIGHSLGCMEVCKARADNLNLCSGCNVLSGLLYYKQGTIRS